MANEPSKQSAKVTPAAPGLRWFGELLLMLAAMAVAGYAAIKWKIGGYYGITAIAMLFIFYTTCKALRYLPKADGQTGIQFNLRTVLWWVVPYVAIAAAILGWSGPYEKDFLNDNAKAASLTILTQLWCGMYVGSRFRAAYRKPSPDALPTAMPHALEHAD